VNRLGKTKEVKLNIIKKYFATRRKEKQEQLELLRSIAGSLKELEESIDKNARYGNAIKTTRAARY
jgi:hypothetical protein